MKQKSAEIKVEVFGTNGFLQEKYAYSSGAVEPLPAHSHAEYQFGINLDATGGFECRGSSFNIPPMVVTVVHAGEKHAPDDTQYVESARRFQMLYAMPDELLHAAREIGWRKNELPYFADVLIADAVLTKKYLRLFDFEKNSNLFRDTAKLDFLSYLIKKHAQNKVSAAPHQPHPAAVKIAREFLDANFARAVSLDELSAATGVGKFYLCREFSRVVGVSPHLYQNHLRLDSARKLLLQNKTPADIAYELGFYDQSHFGKNFKKLVGITPQSYASSAIFS